MTTEATPMVFHIKPAEARKLWFQALRSGDYIQGTGTLERRGAGGTVKHCCLGVACRVYMIHEGPLEVAEDGAGAMEFNGNGGSLPDKVRLWLGLASQGGRHVSSSNPTTTLVGDNDSARLTFEQIADLIENNKIELQS